MCLVFGGIVGFILPALFTLAALALLAVPVLVVWGVWYSRKVDRELERKQAERDALPPGERMRRALDVLHPKND